MVGFPLLLIPLAIYNIVALLMPGVPLTDPLVKLTLVSGVEWQVTLSDVLLSLGVLLLLLEIMKGARPGSKYLTDHLLSLIVFAGAAAEFVMLPKFGTSTFFLLTLMAMVDFLGGIALHARRGSVTSRRSHTPVETPEGEHRIEPVPAAPAPAPTATPAAESVSDNSRPKLSVDRPSVDRPSVDKPSVDKPSMDKPVVDKPVVDKPAGEPSPTIPSPDLQPGTGSSSSPGASH